MAAFFKAQLAFALAARERGRHFVCRWHAGEDGRLHRHWRPAPANEA
jgi:hypothetical protein